jgi:hypothetical protein
MNDRALGMLLEAIEAADEALFRVINLALNADGENDEDRREVAATVANVRNQLSPLTATTQTTMIDGDGSIYYLSGKTGSPGGHALERLKGDAADD